MQRKALIVAGAAGPDEAVNSVLQRFGFAPAAAAPSLKQAVGRLRDEHFDLLVIPLQDVEPVELATLERDVIRPRSTSVIGTTPQPDPDLLLRAMRAGIQDILIFPPDPKDLSGAVDRIMRRGQADSAPGQAIAVYSAKGGLGATSIAVNLAYGLAKAKPDGRVALVDLVVSGGDVGVMLDLKPAYDIGDLVAKVNRIDAELLRSLLTPCSGGVWVLPSGERPEMSEKVDATSVLTIIQQLRAHFAFTVLDCEHHLSERTLAALDAADRIVLVTQLNIAALRSMQRTLALFQRLGYGEDKLCVVVNRFQSGEVITPADAAALLDRELYWKLPNDYRASSTALNKGAPVAEHAATSPLSRSFVGLAAKIGGAPVATNGRSAAGSSRLAQLFSRRKA